MRVVSALREAAPLFRVLLSRDTHTSLKEQGREAHRTANRARSTRRITDETQPTRPEAPKHARITDTRITHVWHAVVTRTGYTLWPFHRLGPPAFHSTAAENIKGVVEL